MVLSFVLAAVLFHVCDHFNIFEMLNLISPFILNIAFLLISLFLTNLYLLIVSISSVQSNFSENVFAFKRCAPKCQADE